MKISWLQWNPQKYNPLSDKWSRCAAGRLLTFAGGIIVSAAITQHVTRKAAQEEFDEQLASVKGYYKSLLNTKHMTPAEQAATWTQEDLDRNKSVVRAELYDTMPIDHVATPETDTPRLNNLLREYGESQFTGEEAVKAERRHRPPKVIPSIHLIDEDSYLQDDLNGKHEKQYARWYPRDDALVDSFNELIEDHVRIVGSEFAVLFAKDSDREFIYVRNSHRHVDYEIEIVRGGSYAEDVLGYDPAPVRRKPLDRGEDE